jgi:hypothetical protein
MSHHLVTPRLERDGQVIVSTGVEAKRVEDLDAFLEALEKQGRFRNVLSLQEENEPRDSSRRSSRAPTCRRIDRERAGTGAAAPGRSGNIADAHPLGVLALVQHRALRPRWSTRLSQRVANIEQRDQAAERALAAARSEHGWLRAR